MSKYNIVLVILEGCSHCKEVKESIDTNLKINYSIVSCEKDCSLCDDLEGITKTTKYPMVIVKDTLENKNYIIYQTTNYSDLGNNKQVNNLVLIPTFGTENIINNINNIIK